jgi:hypothetical protein
MVIIHPMTMLIKYNLHEVTEMMNSMIASSKKIAVGDQVLVIDPVLTRESGAISADVLEIRRVLGEEAYLIETEMRERKLVGANQIRQVEPSTE